MQHQTVPTFVLQVEVEEIETKNWEKDKKRKIETVLVFAWQIFTTISVPVRALLTLYTVMLHFCNKYI